MNIKAACGLLLVLLASVAFAAPSVEIKPSEERTALSEFDEDHLDLILTMNGAVVDVHYFYSSYGIANAEVLRDRKGQPTLLQWTVACSVPCDLCELARATPFLSQTSIEALHDMGFVAGRAAGCW